MNIKKKRYSILDIGIMFIGIIAIFIFVAIITIYISLDMELLNNYCDQRTLNRGRELFQNILNYQQ